MEAILATAAADRTFFQWVVYLAVTYRGFFLRGAGITLLIAVISTLIGAFIGLVIGVVRTIPMRENDSRLKKTLVKLANLLLSVYIEVFRGTPMIVQAMVIYYGAAFGGIYMSKMFAAFLIVSINTGAYMAEIVRGGIISIDKGQFEAAHSIGMTHSKTMLYIILPQVIRNILPAIGNEFVINIKDTSVLNVISVTELFFQSKSIAGNNYKYFEVFIITSAIYLAMTFSITRLLRLLEKHMDGSGSYTIQGSINMPGSAQKVKEEK